MQDRIAANSCTQTLLLKRKRHLKAYAGSGANGVRKFIGCKSPSIIVKAYCLIQLCVHETGTRRMSWLCGLGTVPFTLGVLFPLSLLELELGLSGFRSDPTWGWKRDVLRIAPSFII